MISDDIRGNVGGLLDDPCALPLSVVQRIVRYYFVMWILWLHLIIISILNPPPHQSMRVYSLPVLLCSFGASLSSLKCHLRCWFVAADRNSRDLILSSINYYALLLHFAITKNVKIKNCRIIYHYSYHAVWIFFYCCGTAEETFSISRTILQYFILSGYITATANKFLRMVNSGNNNSNHNEWKVINGPVCYHMHIFNFNKTFHNERMS